MTVGLHTTRLRLPPEAFYTFSTSDPSTCGNIGRINLTGRALADTAPNDLSNTITAHEWIFPENNTTSAAWPTVSETYGSLNEDNPLLTVTDREGNIGYTSEVIRCGQSGSTR